MTTEELNQMEDVLAEARRLQDRLRRWSEILADVEQHQDTLFIGYRPDEMRALEYEEIVGLADNEVIRNFIITELRHRIDRTMKDLEQLQWPKGGEE